MVRRISAILAIAALLTVGLAVPVEANGGYYEVTVSPVMAANMVGEEHTITVTIDPAVITGGWAGYYIYAGPNYGEYTEAYLEEGDTQATFTYVGDGGPGWDAIGVFVETDDGSYKEFTVYKCWLSDKFSGGGTIIQQLESAKKQDFYKISWGGWAGDYGEGYYQAGHFNVTFHNVSINDLDGAKFVSNEFIPGAGIGSVYLYWTQDVGGYDPAPPESAADFIALEVWGQLLDKNGDVLMDSCFLKVYALDGGEPGVDDAVQFQLFDSGYNPIYDSSTDFTDDVYVDPCSLAPLDSGNLQIDYTYVTYPE